MVKKRKKKNAITLLALVITIVIMLLLAGVAIQMTMGENGLIAKSVQAQKEQAKAELYDTAKLSYMSLNAKALENGQPSPQAELALSTTEFRDRYDIVGDDITDKKGNVIDTKENVLKAIMGEIPGSTTSGGSVTPGTTLVPSTPGGSVTPSTTPVPSTPAESWPKTVAGVTIPEEDKDKMILKLKVNGNRQRIKFSGTYLSIISVDYGNGNSDQNLNLAQEKYVEYTQGEYILKISKIEYGSIERATPGNYEIEVLQWGEIAIKNQENFIVIDSVSKVYEPEPDKVAIRYVNAKFTEIPEWLFSKKVTSKVMSEFHNSMGLTSIPEGLFKNNVNAEYFDDTFYGCAGLTSIPENLFKYNVNARDFCYIFKDCTGLTSIPENLFRYNINAFSFKSIFYGCKGLTSISENLFKHNVKSKEFEGAFFQCESITSIPEDLFKNNVNAEEFNDTFRKCTGLTTIPEKIIEFAKKVKENRRIY